MLWKILDVKSPMRKLDQGRTIPAPVDYEGILKMEGASGLIPLESTLKFQFRPDNVVVLITESLAGAASCQVLSVGSLR